MKKTMSLLSLVLVLVFLFSVPIVSKATVYDGYIGSNYYKCTVTGSTSYIYSKVKYDKSAPLKTEVTPLVKYVYMGHVDTFGYVNDDLAATGTSITYNRTYASMNGDPDIGILPANGFFANCTYNSYIRSTTVIYGVLEVFSTL